MLKMWADNPVNKAGGCFQLLCGRFLKCMLKWEFADNPLNMAVRRVVIEFAIHYAKSNRDKKTPKKVLSWKSAEVI